MLKKKIKLYNLSPHRHLDPAVLNYWRSNFNRKKWMAENNQCKSLVVYGSNLGSTVNYLYYNRFIRSIVNIPSNLNSIILGILLSDGHLFKNKAGNTLFSFKQTIKRFDFFLICFFKFSHFCQSTPRLDTTTLKGKTYSLIFFSTRVFLPPPYPFSRVSGGRLRRVVRSLAQALFYRMTPFILCKLKKK